MIIRCHIVLMFTSYSLYFRFIKMRICIGGIDIATLLWRHQYLPLLTLISYCIIECTQLASLSLLQLNVIGVNLDDSTIGQELGPSISHLVQRTYICVVCHVVQVSKLCFRPLKWSS